ncbi:MAG: DUF4230 domain-containing protein [Prevotella sp.]|nr:DUF4230 domain-containing protein [Prevotella sp.]
MMKTLTYIKIGLIVIAIALLIVGFFWLKNLTKNDHIDFGPDEEIGIKPTQIQSIKAIGEWEFLSVSAEELVDTTRRGLIMSDELARIYYGTLRLGVDMHQVKPGWIKTSGDSITMTLPKIGLLDKDFIDEARTKPFHESGSWSAADREALYKKAYRMMRQHCLTKENLQAAEANGQEQFRNMLQSMGYKHVKITFER